jgi:hypothetical protein
MTEIKLNSLVVDGISSLGFDVGMQKHDIETILGKSLGEADVETDDVSCYLWEMDNGIVWSINFDKEDTCFEIKLDFDEQASNFYIELAGQKECIDNTTTFERIVEIFCSLSLDWQFDIKRMYLQTACVRLPSRARLYFAFGNKKSSDYGLFLLSFLHESHKFNLR